MPEILKHPDGSTNWNSFFMAFAAATVMILQAWGQIQHGEIQSSIHKVPSETTNKDFGEVAKRIEAIEKRQQELLLKFLQGGKK